MIKSWPYYTSVDIKAVNNVLLGKDITALERFEEMYSKYLGGSKVIAVANGSLAIELALLALGISQGDEVIVTCRSFIASASSISRVGAKPVFVDVDRDTQNIRPDAITKAITPRTKAIICVHHAGCPCEMKAILDIAKRKNLRVIEDCAQAHGAKYNNRFLGTIGNIGCFSFCEDKILSLKEGGLVVTSDRVLFEKMWSIHSHGRNRKTLLKLKQSFEFPYFCDSIGTNFRLTELQAALGCSLLPKVSSWVRVRRHNAFLYNNIFKEYPFFRVPIFPSTYYHSYYEYYVFVVPEELAKLGITRSSLLKVMQKKGVSCNVGSCPEIYREKAFKDFSLPNRCLIAEELRDTSIKFLCHPRIIVPSKLLHKIFRSL